MDGIMFLRPKVWGEGLIGVKGHFHSREWKTHNSGG